MFHQEIKLSFPIIHGAGTDQVIIEFFELRQYVGLASRLYRVEINAFVDMWRHMVHQKIFDGYITAQSMLEQEIEGFGYDRRQIGLFLGR